MRPADDLLHQLALLDADLLDIDHRVQDELGAQRPRAQPPQLVEVLLLALAERLQVGGPLEAEALKLVGEAVLAGLDLAVEDRLRHRHVEPLDQIVKDALPGLVELVEPGPLAEARPDVLEQLRQRVELAGGGREVVVELGQLTLLDAADGRRDLSRLPGVLPGQQLGLERPALALGDTGDRLVEALDKIAAADLV